MRVSARVGGPRAPGASSFQLGPGSCGAQGRESGQPWRPLPGGKGEAPRLCRGRSRLPARRCPGAGPPLRPPALRRGRPQPAATWAPGFTQPSFVFRLLSFYFVKHADTPAPRAPKAAGTGSRRGSAGGERCWSGQPRPGVGGGGGGVRPWVRGASRGPRDPSPAPAGSPVGSREGRPREFRRLLSIAARRNKKRNSKHLLRAWLRIGALRVRLCSCSILHLHKPELVVASTAHPLYPGCHKPCTTPDPNLSPPLRDHPSLGPSGATVFSKLVGTEPLPRTSPSPSCPETCPPHPGPHPYSPFKGSCYFSYTRP